MAPDSTAKRHRRRLLSRSSPRIVMSARYNERRGSFRMRRLALRNLIGDWSAHALHARCAGACGRCTGSGAAGLRRRLSHQRAGRDRHGVHAADPAACEVFVRRQLGAGATARSRSRADVFFSADLEWMDYLQARNLIDRSTRRNLPGNRLVLVAPADSKIELKIAPGFALAPRSAATGGSPLAIRTPCRSASTRARR